MSGHCFISYSTADGIEFTRKLADSLEGGEQFIPAWFDKRDLRAGEDWDDQIMQAIKDCRCFLFVMSTDSTKAASNCKVEIVSALRYKKPIVPILLQKNVDQPFLLGTREWIDFTGEFRAGLAKLRTFWHDLDSPAGQLRAMKYRLADAEHALRRATGDEENRIRAEIAELESQINAQERVAENPEAAKKQTEQNIQNGLERERKPQLPVASFQSSKFINQPPGVAQNYFQDRTLETEQAILFLKNEAQRVLTVVGRGGAGKTAMVCRLLKFVENGGLPDDFERKHGRVDVDGIVYLSEAGSRKVNFANLFEDLCKLLPAASAEKLSALYREPQTSTESKTVQLLAAFQGLKQVIVLLDNFENVVDAEKGQVRDAELDEALRAILHAPHHPVKIIITTRVSARELDTFEPARQRLLPLDTGLQPEYAREAFVLMDEGNLVGIKNAGADLLNLAVTRTLGLPRALEALYAALRTDRFTTLQELLDLPILPEQVVQAYVGEAFNRLDTNAQKVMQALAVYNRPVTPAPVDYLLAPHVPAIDSAPILQRLANMRFARKETGRFYLHPVDREFAFGLIQQDTKDSRLETGESLSPQVSNHLAFTQQDLLTRAADYFAAARKPRAEWKKLDDLSAQLAEFDLRCAAGDYDTAASVLEEIDYDYLLSWGHITLLIDLHKQVSTKVTDVTLVLNNLKMLGLAHNGVGKIKESTDYYLSGLDFARKSKYHDWEGIFLGSLGDAYLFLGNVQKSIEYYKQALDVNNEISGYGTKEDTLEYLTSKISAIRIARRYSKINDPQKDTGLSTKITNNQQSVIDYIQINAQMDQAIDVKGIGDALLSLQNYQKANESFQQAIQIADETSFLQIQNNARWGLAQAYLFQNDLVNARATIEAALQYDVPQNNHNASALHGIIALRQGDEVAARGVFVRTIGQADEILSKTAEYYSALDAKGIALSGLVVSGKWEVDSERLKALDEAVETFRRAREIAPHAGVVKSVLRLFDELVKCDEEGILNGVREAIEGK